MLYLVWLALQQFLSMATELIGVIIIFSVGIVIILSALGFRGATTGMLRFPFKVLSILRKYFLKFLAWMVKKLTWICKRTYKATKNGLNGRMPTWAATVIATVIATLTTLAVLAVII